MIIVMIMIMIIMIITRLKLHDDVNDLVDELFIPEENVQVPIPMTQEEIVQRPNPMTQEEIVHLPTIIPNDLIFGIVSPMAPKTRTMFSEVHGVYFESCQRIAI